MLTQAPAPSSAPSVVARDRIDAALSAFLDRQRADWADPDRARVFDAMHRFILGAGKRIRPLFCYWGWRGAGAGGVSSVDTSEDSGARRSRDEDGLFAVAAALELFHSFALIHDDIMDASDVRRGEPSVHRVFAQVHREMGGRGDALAFGLHTALLCGDLCAAWADQVFAESTLPAARVGAAQRLFARMRAEAIAGQYLDLRGQTAGPAEWTVDRALQVTRLKTARYTVTRPLQIGAALGGGSDELLAAYAAFGDPLGEAFQLRDDILGCFGAARATGKSVLDDLRAAKPTVLLAATFARAGKDQAAMLRLLVGDPDLDDAGAGQVLAVMRATGALAMTEGLIERRWRRAMRALDAAPVDPAVRAELAALAAKAVRRSS
jgi:geranylgeranyl diphosphate synthase type I